MITAVVNCTRNNSNDKQKTNSCCFCSLDIYIFSAFFSSSCDSLWGVLVKRMKSCVPAARTCSLLCLVFLTHDTCSFGLLSLSREAGSQWQHVMFFFFLQEPTNQRCQAKRSNQRKQLELFRIKAQSSEAIVWSQLETHTKEREVGTVK